MIVHILNPNLSLGKSASPLIISQDSLPVQLAEAVCTLTVKDPKNGEKDDYNKCIATVTPDRKVVSAAHCLGNRDFQNYDLLCGTGKILEYSVPLRPKTPKAYSIERVSRHPESDFFTIDLNLEVSSKYFYPIYSKESLPDVITPADWTCTLSGRSTAKEEVNGQIRVTKVDLDLKKIIAANTGTYYTMTRTLLLNRDFEVRFKHKARSAILKFDPLGEEQKKENENKLFAELSQYLNDKKVFFIGHGDSGGPLLCHKKSTALHLYVSTKDSLIGIVSGGVTEVIKSKNGILGIETETRISYPDLEQVE